MKKSLIESFNFCAVLVALGLFLCSTCLGIILNFRYRACFILDIPTITTAKCRLILNLFVTLQKYTEEFLPLITEIFKKAFTKRVT